MNSDFFNNKTNIVIVLLLLLIGVSFYGVNVFDQGQKDRLRQEYVISRSSECTNIANSRKKESEGAVELPEIKMASYVYVAEKDICTYETLRANFVEGESGFVFYQLNDLFRGESLGQYIKISRDSEEVVYENCKSYSILREEYFGKGLNCILFQ